MMENKKEYLFTCDCGCGIIKYTLWHEDNDEMIFIEHYVSSFYTRQNFLFGELWQRIKLAWMMLRGKEFSLYDIVISNKEDVERFKKFLKEF
jgi:hypothetical protein